MRDGFWCCDTMAHADLPGRIFCWTLMSGSLYLGKNEEHLINRHFWVSEMVSSQGWYRSVALREASIRQWVSPSECMHLRSHAQLAGYRLPVWLCPGRMVSAPVKQVSKCRKCLHCRDILQNIQFCLLCIHIPQMRYYILLIYKLNVCYIHQIWSLLTIFYFTLKSWNRFSIYILLNKASFIYCSSFLILGNIK